jgi:hypothetical protein
VVLEAHAPIFSLCAWGRCLYFDWLLVYTEVFLMSSLYTAGLTENSWEGNAKYYSNINCKNIIGKLNLSQLRKMRHCVLGVFAKSRKATISFVMSVRPSVCLSARIEQLGSHWTDYCEI